MNRPMIIKHSQHIDQTEIPPSHGFIFKKYADENMEISLYQMNQGQRFYLTVPRHEKSIKTYLILQGKFQGAKPDEIYGAGDLILLTSDNDNLFVYTEETVMAYVTSYIEGSFHENAEQYKMVMETMNTIQDKDEYTKDHCVAVSDIFREMALVIGWEGDQLIYAILAAKYHDIGKVRTPEYILNKPTLLLPEEYDIMKRHVEDCKHYLNGYLNESVIALILQHHERLDGSGYPNQLKGDEISEEAKVLAVADSYHAMRSERVYKTGKTKEEAIQELYGLADIQYEKKYIDILVDVLNQNPQW